MVAWMVVRAPTVAGECFRCRIIAVLGKLGYSNEPKHSCSSNLNILISHADMANVWLLFVDAEIAYAHDSVLRVG